MSRRSYAKKKSLSFNKSPEAKKCLITKDGDELSLPVNSDAVKKYIVKKKTAR